MYGGVSHSIYTKNQFTNRTVYLKAKVVGDIKQYSNSTSHDSGLCTADIAELAGVGYETQKSSRLTRSLHSPEQILSSTLSTIILTTRGEAEGTNTCRMQEITDENCKNFLSDLLERQPLEKYGIRFHPNTADSYIQMTSLQSDDFILNLLK